MEELIKLREYVVKEKEKASSLIKFTKAIDPESVWIKANKRSELAFSDIIERLDLILNNSVVKPSERRSPTDESFDGVSRPNERQNPQEYKILECGCSIKMIDYGFDAVVNENCAPHMEYLKSVKDKEGK